MPVGSVLKTNWENDAVVLRAVYVLDPSTGEPMGSALAPLQVGMAQWHYVGSQIITCDGAVAAVVPAEATAFVLEARGGAVYYAINGVTCSALDSYCPEDAMRSIGPMDNLDRLWVYGGGATVYAHIQYWRSVG